MRRAGKGISTLEFALALAVIVVVAYVALRGLKEIEEYVEMKAVEGTLRNAETGLRYALAERINRGEERRIAELVGSNPVRLLAKEPERYLGELALVDREVPPGSWAYDKSRQELCYRPLLAEHLQIDGNETLLRWRIAAVIDAAAADRVQWAQLVTVNRYVWF